MTIPTPAIRLISFRECPYVQRSAIALRAKGVAHEVTHIDLSAKPDWFLALNPRGKVPVVVVGERVVYESAVINELLEDLLPDPALLPPDPFDRAEARMWIDFASTETMTHMARVMFASALDEEQTARERLDASLQIVEAELRRRASGPFFFGDRFTLVDATWAPCFDRFRTLEASWGWTIPDGVEHVRAWAEAVLSHPPVAATVLDDLVERYDEYRQRQLGRREA